MNKLKELKVINKKNKINMLSNNKCKNRINKNSINDNSVDNKSSSNDNKHNDNKNYSNDLKSNSLLKNLFNLDIDCILRDSLFNKNNSLIKDSKNNEISNKSKDNEINKNNLKKKKKISNNKKEKLDDTKSTILEEIAKSIKNINLESVDYLINLKGKNKSFFYATKNLSYKNTGEIYFEKNPYDNKNETKIYDLSIEDIKATQIGADIINERSKNIDNGYNGVSEVSNIDNSEAKIIIGDYLKDALLSQGLRVRSDIRESLKNWLLFQDPNRSLMHLYEQMTPLKSRDVDYSRPI